jgi:NAD(P)-dependent dehydrogenase (short-subunit alcohol dehydrogenase family)
LACFHARTRGLGILTLFDEALNPGSVNRPGIDAVDSDSVPRLVGGYGLRESQDGTLRGGIDGTLNEPDVSRNRASTHDRTRFSLAHERKYRAAEKRQSKHVDRKYALPIAVGSIDHITHRPDSSVVAQDVDATMLLVDSASGGATNLWITNIEAPFDIETDHSIAALLKCFDERGSYAAGCPGNNDDSGRFWRDLHTMEDSNSARRQNEQSQPAWRARSTWPTQAGTMMDLMPESAEHAIHRQHGSTAIITGAGGGLGRAVALRLSADGFTIAVVDVDEQAAAETCRQVRGERGVAETYAVDLRNHAAIERCIRQVESELGPIGALVNNAAVFPSGPFLDSTIEDYDDAVAVNQRAYFLVAQMAARRMRDRGGGAIVNMGSITANGGWDDMASYVVTKGAAAALTRALATELGRYGIRVNCVAPGAFPTRAEKVHADPEEYEKRIIDSQSLKRRGTLEELAAAVSFLIGPDSSFVTGQTLNVDGGWIMS